MKRRIVVICGLDRHARYIENQIRDIRALQIDADIAIATSGNINLPKQLRLTDLAHKLGVVHYEQNRQQYITSQMIKNYIVPMVSYSELYAEIQVSRYFYEQGYQFVYYNHPDILIYKDFTGLYESWVQTRSNISCIRPFMNTFKTTIQSTQYQLSPQLLYKMTESYALQPNIFFRLPSISVLWSKLFLDRLYRDLKGRELFDFIQYGQITLCNDVVMFDLNRKIITNFQYNLFPAPAYYFSQNELLNTINTLMFHYGDPRHKLQLQGRR